jgi:anti-anti-sigma factor
MAGSVSSRPLSAPSTWMVLAMAGEVDLATAPRLRLLLQDADDETSRDVVLDLCDVTYMDCSGLPALLEARDRLGARFWLRGLPPPVTRLLELTGLRDEFAVLDEAGSAPPGCARAGTGQADRQDHPGPPVAAESPISLAAVASTG